MTSRELQIVEPDYTDLGPNIGLTKDYVSRTVTLSAEDLVSAHFELHEVSGGA